jgi:MFS family permease
VPSAQETQTEQLPRIARTPFYYGWVIVAIAGLASFASAPGQTYTFSVFLDSFIEDLGLSSTYVATLYLFGSLTASGLIIFVGRSLDRFGPRIMLVVAALFLGTGAMVLSRANAPWELFIGFALMRTMGQGALSLIPATMVSIWFVRRRAMALAIMALGGAAASGTFPIYGTTLIDQFGWRTAWIAIAITTWSLLIIPAIIFVRRSPESVGLLPDGDSHERRPGTKTRAARPDDEATHNSTMSEALHSKALWFLILAGTGQSLIATGVMFHQVEIMTSKGLNASVAAGVFGVTAPAAIAGQFLSGYLAGRFPERYLIAIGQFMLMASILMLLVVSAAWQAYVYGALLGLTVGFLMNSMNSIWPAYFGRKHLGSVRGVTNFGMMAAAAIGPLPLAAVVDATGSYTGGILGYLLLPPLCIAAALAAGRPKHQRREPVLAVRTAE